MSALRISLFGNVTVIHATASTPLQLSQGSQALFAFLLLQRHLIPRDILMDVFWGEYSTDRAQSNLTTAVWRLRQVLEPSEVTPGTYLISKKRGEVGFNWDSSHWLDTDSFEKQLLPVLRKPVATLDVNDLKTIEEALSLYRGDLLEGMYEDWALRERERFRSLHLSCLTRLMQYFFERKEYEQSILFGQEILRRDPLHEEIHRTLMRMYLQSGQHAHALRQYEQCRAVLRRELNVSPLEETEILYHQIITASRVSVPTSQKTVSSEVAQLLHELQAVKDRLAEMGQILERVSQAAERLTLGGDEAVTIR